jgi:hypothetical protein
MLETRSLLVAGTGLGQAMLQVFFQRVGIGGHRLLSRDQRGPQRFRQRLSRLDGLQRVGVYRGGRTLVTAAFDQGGLVEQRDQVAGLQGQRTFQRFGFLVVQLQLPQRGSQVHIKRRRLVFAFQRPPEQLPGLGRVALAQHPQPGDVENQRVFGREVAGLEQQPHGRGSIPGCMSAFRLLQKRADALFFFFGKHPVSPARDA